VATSEGEGGEEGAGGGQHSEGGVYKQVEKHIFQKCREMYRDGSAKTYRN